MNRPVGITFLSVIHVISGALVLAMTYAIPRNSMDSMGSFGVSPNFAYLSIFLLGLLSVISGVGMWLGKTWGWWTGAFYVVYSIARNANALRLIPMLSGMLSASDPSVETYYVRYGVRIISYLLILLYFYKRNVLEYFALGHISKWKSLGTLLSETAGAFLFSAIVTDL